MKNVKKFLSVVLTLCMVLSLLPMTALASDFGTDWTLNDAGLLTITSDAGMSSWSSTGYLHTKDVVSVAINNGVTNIGAGAFFCCTNLVSVTIPDTVTSINDGAFNGCTSLTSVDIPNLVTSIGVCAFQDCASLQSVNIPNLVTSIGDNTFNGCTNLAGITIGNAVETIGANAFYGCSGITSLSIPNSVTTIGNNAFDGCTGITSALVIPDSVTSIGDNTFNGCTGLNSITIGNAVETIGANAFYGCSGITSLSIPNSVTTIGDYAFYLCTGITSALVIPSSVTSIGTYAFCACSITSLTLPDTAISIGQYAFSGCYGITSLNIPDAMTTISDYAFYGLGITSLTIPNTVTAIGEGAFYGCNNLINVIFEKTTPPASIGTDVFGTMSLNGIYVPAGCTDTYKNKTELSSYISYIRTKTVSLIKNGTTTYYYYPTLSDALEAAENGDTITLLSNITEEATNAKSSADVVTIDGGGFTVTGSDPTNSVALTLTGTGTVILKDLTLQGGAASTASTGLDVSGSISVQSYGTVTANGGAAMSSYGVTNSGTGTVDVTEAVASGLQSGFGAYNTGSGTINVGSATGNGAMNGMGAFNLASGTINVTTADGSSSGVFNLSFGTVNVTTATGSSYGVYNGGTGAINAATVAATAQGGVAVNNDHGVVNVKTITSGTFTTTTNMDVTAVALNKGTGASCVLGSITIANSGTTRIGTLPDVYKGGACSAKWYTDVALTNLFTMQGISPEATALYSSFYEEPINTAAIAGVTAPVTGAIPTSTIVGTTQYTATILWSPTASTFAAGTVYTATITLTPKTGYTLSGVSANFFTVAGATTTNTANSGVVTAVFPATISSSGTGGTGGTGDATKTTNPVTTVSGSTATTTLTPTVSGGIASGSVTAAQMSDALDKAKAAVGTSGTPNVEIQIDGASGVSSVGTTIPHASMQALVSGDVGALTISGPTGSVSFDADTLKTISGAASGDVTVTVAKTDSSGLSDAAKQAVGSHPVFTFSVTSGGSTISQFGGDVTVSVPYTPAPGEDTNAIVIYYIAADGTPTLVQDARYDAATSTVVFTTTHFSTYAVAYNKVSFTDVSDTAWYSDAVTFLAARGITSGTTATTFGPDATLTRGQFITLILRAYGISADASATDNFSDAGDTYYTGYLAAAKELGITSGVGDNKFAPDQAITRQEMFTLLYNALKVLDQLPSGTSGKTLADFSDADGIAVWAKDAMTLMVETGTVSGSGGELSPTKTTTRAEMAQVLYNLLKK